jgi:hypothetical protein
MRYAIVKCVNGVFTVDSEHGTLNGAIVNFHGLCQTLWNASDVNTAKVEIVDEQLNVVNDYREYIHHEQTEE